ncbi:MAG TPA: hypothetical protein VMV80_05480 [Anaerolineales bacterium]|nr:hypothetical protein [Anaerolineales bacterium]HUV92515.1 hypothetical protein [Anaerolineales bacterium]
MVQSASVGVMGGAWDFRQRQQVAFACAQVSRIFSLAVQLQPQNALNKGNGPG